MKARIEQLRQEARHLWCVLTGGHDRLMHFENDRLALRCVSCGSETPGWTLDGPPPSSTNALQRDAAIWAAARRIA